MRKRLVFPLAFGLTLLACGLIDTKPPHFETSRAQPGPFEGQVTVLHTNPNLVSTEDKTSKGTVYFTSAVRPDTDFQKLHVGDRIKGRIVVESNNVYITDVRIIR